MVMYKTIRKESGLPPGTIVYSFMECDYGCASDATRNFGFGFETYISVTLNPEGKAPAFTMRESSLQEISS